MLNRGYNVYKISEQLEKNKSFLKTKMYGHFEWTDGFGSDVIFKTHSSHN